MKKKANEIGKGDSIEVRGDVYTIEDAIYDYESDRIVVSFEESPNKIQYHPDELVDIRD